MKRYLCAGERYAPFPAKIKLIRPCNFLSLRASILYTIGLFFMCLQANMAKGTDPASDRSRAVPVAESGVNILQIGDKLPRNFSFGYDPLNPEKKYTLADFKGKAVIIDAWATWCGACISKFQVVDSLSKVYGNNLQFLLIGMIGQDTPADIRTFVLEYLKKYPNFSPTFLIEEPQLNDSFIFSALPHYIWIDTNRRIRAITGSDVLVEEHIKRLIAGLSVNVKEKIR